MKKIILSTFLLFTICAQAQLEIASWDFQNGGNISEWGIVDHDAVNGSTWALRDNFYSGIMGAEPINVLSLNNLGGPGFADEWAILPVQDLSFYSGTHLNLDYLKGFFEAESDMQLLLYAFVSENTPTVANFLTGSPIATITLVGDFNDPPLEVPLAVNIPTAYNVANVHFALAYKWSPTGEGAPTTALELTKVEITADQVLNIKDATIRTNTKIKQNPVAETLRFNLGNTVNAGDLNIKLYNFSGMMVKESKYDEAGISVSDLAAGVYFAVLNDGVSLERLKFIKK